MLSWGLAAKTVMCFDSVGSSDRHERDWMCFYLLIYGEWVADLICFRNGRSYESSIIHLQHVARYSTCRPLGGSGNCSETGALVSPDCNSPLQIRSWLHVVCRRGLKLKKQWSYFKLINIRWANKTWSSNNCRTTTFSSLTNIYITYMLFA